MQFRSGHVQDPVLLTIYLNFKKLQFASFLDPTQNQYLKKLHILPLPDLISFSKLQFMQRFSQNFLPISFQDTWVRNNIRNIEDNEIQLRNANQLQPIHSKLIRLDSFPLYNFPKIWQEFPNEQIKILRKTKEFDHNLKQYVLNDLSDTVTCNRLVCPACIAGRLN